MDVHITFDISFFGAAYLKTSLNKTGLQTDDYPLTTWLLLIRSLFHQVIFHLIQWYGLPFFVAINNIIC
jgi:hypothetical protein